MAGCPQLVKGTYDGADFRCGHAKVRFIGCRLLYNHNLTGQSALNAFCVCEAHVMCRNRLVTVKPGTVARRRNVQHSRADDIHPQPARHLYCRTFDEASQRSVGSRSVCSHADWIAIKHLKLGSVADRGEILR